PASPIAASTRTTSLAGQARMGSNDRSDDLVRRPLDRLASAVVAQHPRELGSGGHLELGEHVGQVETDGPRREKQPAADLPVAEALRGQPRDLPLLRSE